MSKDKGEDLITNGIMWIVLIFATLGVVSTVMWYVKAQEVKTLKAAVTMQTQAMQKMADEVADKRRKIDQANRLLSVAYPGAKLDFLSE